MFLSISYDEHIRLFDARNIKQPLRKVHVGGGVWRTKWHPNASRKSDVLLACMHGGFNIVNVGDALTAADACEHWSAGEDEGCTITTRFDKHESIAYGVDWSSQHLENLGQKSVIASCSFYDHLLHLWHA
jgi:diphthamide biosynthesis protein 7